MEQRSEPRISANKLGEYMVTKPARRKKIIEDQKWPPPFQATIYSQAERAISRYFIDSEIQNLEKSILMLRKKTTKSDWEKQKNINCIEAIESFIQMKDDFDLQKYGRRIDSSKGITLMWGGLKVNVKPNIIITNKNRAGNSCLGAVMFHFSKFYPHKDESAQYTSVLLSEALQKNQEKGVIIRSQQCFVLDIFSQKIYSAPKSYAMIQRQIFAACEEIVGRWPQLQKPENRN